MRKWNKKAGRGEMKSRKKKIERETNKKQIEKRKGGKD